MLYNVATKKFDRKHFHFIKKRTTAFDKTCMNSMHAAVEARISKNNWSCCCWVVVELLFSNVLRFPFLYLIDKKAF